MNCKKKVKSIDTFGKPINLRFKKEEQFSTFLGGLTTISIYILIGVYSVQRCNIIANNSQSSISSTLSSLNINEDLGKVDIPSTKMMFYMSLWKNDNMSNYDISQYFNLEFQQLNQNLEFNTQTIEKSFSLRKCEPKDFGSDSDSMKHFQQVNNSFYLILCPDIQNLDQLFLSGDITPNFGNVTSLQFNFSRCDNRSKICKSDEEFSEFIQDLVIGPALQQQQIEFSKYGEIPTYKQIRQLQFITIDTLYHTQQNSFIKLNDYLTQDDLIQYGQSTFEGQFFDVSRSTQTFVPSLGNTLATWSFYLDDIQVSHLRQSYRILQMLSDVGGVISIFIALFSFILSPFEDFNLNLKIFKKLYTIKRMKNNSQIKKNFYTDKNFQKFTLYSKIVLYINLMFEKIICFDKCKNSSNKQQKYYQKCSEYLEEELDIIRLIKSQRKLFEQEQSFQIEISDDDEQFSKLDQSSQTIFQSNTQRQTVELKMDDENISFNNKINNYRNQLKNSKNLSKSKNQNFINKNKKILNADFLRNLSTNFKEISKNKQNSQKKEIKIRLKDSAIKFQTQFKPKLSNLFNKQNNQIKEEL